MIYIILLLIIEEIDKETIKRDNPKLKELNNGKVRFFSIIAHDLKKPINPLIRLGQMLLEENDDADAKYRLNLQSEKIKASLSCM